MADIREVKDENELEKYIQKIMVNPLCLGVWLQKSKRNATETQYLNYHKIDSTVKIMWINTKRPFI